MWTPVTCPVVHYVLVMRLCRKPIKQTPHTLSDVCAGEQGCTSAEPLTSLSGSCHVPAVCDTVKTQGIVLVWRIVSQLLSSIWPQSEQLNETLLPLEQWGVKSLASMACVRISIVLVSDMFYLKLFIFWPLKPKLWCQSQPNMTNICICLPEFLWSIWPPSSHSISLCHETNSIWQVFLQQIEVLNYLVSRKIFRRGHFRRRLMSLEIHLPQNGGLWEGGDHPGWH